MDLSLPLPSTWTLFPHPEISAINCFTGLTAPHRNVPVNVACRINNHHPVAAPQGTGLQIPLSQSCFGGGSSSPMGRRVGPRLTLSRAASMERDTLLMSIEDGYSHRDRGPGTCSRECVELSLWKKGRLVFEWRVCYDRLELTCRVDGATSCDSSSLPVYDLPWSFLLSPSHLITPKKDLPARG